MKTLTIFTPTFNRANLLPQLYESLCKQTSQDFEWLIIDDGSVDNTKELVVSWLAASKIKIKYVYKDNGGMHTGHNLAYKLIKTPFNVCIDSDDYMPSEAVAIIIKETKMLESYHAGIIALDSDIKGNLIGTKIPEHLTSCKLNELYSLHKVKGDKKLIYRTEIVKQFPAYPIFEREKFVPLDYLYLLIDQKFYLKPVNEIVCIVEYQLDGSSMNIMKQYRKNPRGFAFSRISRINFGTTLKERFKNAIHLVSSALFVNELSLLRKSNKTMLVFFAIPFGLVLNLYIRYKTN